ncbi:Enoyl-[acyl-carrier-protein] reductase [Dirofilaria immitis]
MFQNLQLAAIKPTYLITVIITDTNEELYPAYLTPANYDREQKIVGHRTTTAFQRDDDEVFPAFPQQIDSELTNATDETMSVATNVSEEEQQLLVFDTAEDDIFSDDIAVAEEAFADEVMSKTNNDHKDFKKKQVNVISALLSDLNLVVSSLNNSSSGAGYITKIAVQQSFNRELGDIYAAINNQENCYSSGKIPTSNDDKTTANFQFYSFSDGQAPSIKVQIEGFRATLDDIILMHLSAFTYDGQKTNVPLNLKINLIDTQITVRDPKTKPFQIKLNDCVIEQTVEDENS